MLDRVRAESMLKNNLSIGRTFKEKIEKGTHYSDAPKDSRFPNPLNTKPSLSGVMYLPVIPSSNDLLNPYRSPICQSPDPTLYRL